MPKLSNWHNRHSKWEIAVVSILALLWGGSQAAPGLSGRVSIHSPTPGSANPCRPQRAPESGLSSIDYLVDPLPTDNLLMIAFETASVCGADQIAGVLRSLAR